MNIIEITSFEAPELELYASKNETRLMHFNEPAPGLFIAESPNVIERALRGGHTPISFLGDEEAIEKLTSDSSLGALIAEQFSRTPVYKCGTTLLKSITSIPMTRGLLALMKRNPLPTLEEICAGKRRIAICENVVNPTNIGAIFRSAAALNMDALILTEGCADPLYRRASRVSMGTVFQIPWTYVNRDTLPRLPILRCDEEKSAVRRYWPDRGMEFLHEQGFKVAAMALTDNSVSIDDPAPASEEKLGVLLGTEGTGLMDETIALCDYTVKIPMTHGVDSLNVAAASAVAFWVLGNK